MASRHFDSVNSLTKRLITIAGSFQAKGSGTPVILNGFNSFTVARTGTGLYTIQLADNYSGLAQADVQLVQATPTNTVSVVLVSNTSTTPGASMNLLIGTFAAPQTATDITQTAGDQIMFNILLRNSSIVS